MQQITAIVYRKETNTAQRECFQCEPFVGIDNVFVSKCPKNPDYYYVIAPISDKDYLAEYVTRSDYNMMMLQKETFSEVIDEYYNNYVQCILDNEIPVGLGLIEVAKTLGVDPEPLINRREEQQMKFTKTLEIFKKSLLDASAN